MTWARLDDQWDISTRLIRAAEKLRSDAPHAMWSRAVTHCNRELTDGRIHGSVLRSKTYHRKPAEVVAVLVEVGAFVLVGDDEYEVHNFLRWNETREQIESKRASKKANGHRGGLASGEARAKLPIEKVDQTLEKLVPALKQTGSKGEAGASGLLAVRFDKNEPLSSPLLSSPREDQQRDPPIGPPRSEPTQSATSPAEPAPTQAVIDRDVKPSKPSRKKPATRCPASDAMWVDVETWCALWKIQASSERPKFLDYHRAHASLFADWGAAWRTWNRNAERFAATANGSRYGPAPVQRTPGYQAEELRKRAAFNAECDARRDPNDEGPF